MTGVCANSCAGTHFTLLYFKYQVQRNNVVSSSSSSKQTKLYGVTVSLSDAEFDRVSRFIEQNVGIKLPYSKKILVESRLQKIIRQKGFDSFQPYLDMAIGKKAIASETIRLVDQITTNKTDFFREADHFDFLRNEIIAMSQRTTNMPIIKVWCAACSTGEEPYTIAMVLNQLKLQGVIPDFHITATDISHSALQVAVKAEYNVARIGGIPHELRRKFLLKHKDPTMKTVRIVKSLRDKITFGVFNLLSSTFNEAKRFDAIFCRNVYIYFDRPTQELVTRKLLTNLKGDGTLYLGHSETLNGLNLSVKAVSNAVYKPDKSLALKNAI